MRMSTPFLPNHLHAGARMQSIGDWWLPSFYTSVDEEYWRVRTTAGFVDYSFQSAIEVSGPEALNFLQQVCVNDLSRIGPGRALYTTIHEETAKFVDETVVFWLDEDRFIVNGGAAPRSHHLLALLQEWSAGLQLRLSELGTCFLAVQGPLSRQILSRALKISDMPFMSVREDYLEGMHVLVARTGYSGELGFEIYVRPQQASRLWKVLLELGSADGLAPYGVAVTALLSVEKGLLSPPDFYSGSTPLELGLDWMVGFGKPAFNGKTEILERRDRGLYTRLTGFEVEDYAITAGPGTRIFHRERPVGSVTHRNLHGPSIRKNVGRCWVESDFARGDVPLEIEYLGERRPVHLCGMRHYDPGNTRLRS